MNTVLIALLSIAIICVVLAACAGGAWAVQHSRATAQVEREWQAAQVQKLQDFGSTRSLAILPLVEAASFGDGLQAVHGVSYLIKTDQATVLLDAGPDAGSAGKPSTLQANMARLGVSLDDVDAIVISHNHPDHSGGTARAAHTFSLNQPPVDLGRRPMFVPEPMTYPGVTPIVGTQPHVVAPGIATIGSIAFSEIIPQDVVAGRAINYEQALAVNVEGKGIVLITGCGHPTVQRLVARAEALFDRPVVGVVGGLHLGDQDAAALAPTIQAIQALNPRLVALSPHDSGEKTLHVFRDAFPGAYREILVGKEIRFE